MLYELYEGLCRPEKPEAASLSSQLSHKSTNEVDIICSIQGKTTDHKKVTVKKQVTIGWLYNIIGKILLFSMEVIKNLIDPEIVLPNGGSCMCDKNSGGQGWTKSLVSRKI